MNVPEDVGCIIGLGSVNSNSGKDCTEGAEKDGGGGGIGLGCKPNRVASRAQEEWTLVIWDNRRLRSFGEISTSWERRWKEAEVWMMVAPRMVNALLFSSEKEAKVIGRKGKEERVSGRFPERLKKEKRGQVWRLEMTAKAKEEEM
ncbi:hypothetical protein VNO78_23875 [Psophocarpus tetragonolobus]|uniref:Uncharacterized protein n=1 Tax=Psophocarpus tetragonolobus TaxID=3891 RepID=A0AAN9S7I6_PSOTE